MRVNIRRGLGSRALPCGCRAGVYETYDDQVVLIVDVRDPLCADQSHIDGSAIRLSGPEGERGPAAPWLVGAGGALVAFLVWRTWLWLLSVT